MVPIYNSSLLQIHLFWLWFGLREQSVIQTQST